MLRMVYSIICCAVQFLIIIQKIIIDLHFVYRPIYSSILFYDNCMCLRLGRPLVGRKLNIVNSTIIISKRISMRIIHFILFLETDLPSLLRLSDFEP